MTAANPPLFLQAGTYSAAHDRFAHATSLVLPDALIIGSTTYGVPGGVIPPDGGPNDGNAPMNVTVTTSASQPILGIARGTVAISATDVNSNLPQAYIGRNAGSASITLAARDGQDRKDLIYAGIKDTTDGGDADSLIMASFKGAPGTSLFAPTAVVGITKWIPLAIVTVPSSGTMTTSGHVADYRQFVASRGGVRLHSSNGNVPPGVEGALRYNYTNGDLFLYKNISSAAPGWQKVFTKEEYSSQTSTENSNYRALQVLHSPMKRTKFTGGGWDSTPQLESNGNPVSAADMTTETWMTSSGRAIVTITAVTSLENTNSTGRMSFTVYRDAQGASDNQAISGDTDRAIINNVAGRSTLTWSGLITGLNNDVAYRARMLFNNSNGNAWAYFESTRLTVLPIR